jgi:hypothetical protein
LAGNKTPIQNCTCKRIKDICAGAYLNFPLFSGFFTKNQVAEARSNLEVLNANEQGLKQAIMLELEQAFNALKEASEFHPSTITRLPRPGLQKRSAGQTEEHPLFCQIYFVKFLLDKLFYRRSLSTGVDFQHVD